VTRGRPDQQIRGNRPLLSLPITRHPPSVLATEQIGTGVRDPIPCHRPPTFARGAIPTLPVAERTAELVLSLPILPHITEMQIGRCADAIARALADGARTHAQMLCGGQRAARRPRQVRFASEARTSPLLAMLMPQLLLDSVAGLGIAVQQPHGRSALAAAARGGVVRVRIVVSPGLSQP
jgi:hypothetical protein